MTIVILLRFFRRDYHSVIFGHVSKIVTFVTLHFSAKKFKPVVTSSLFFTRPSWITPLCMNFKVFLFLLLSFQFTGLCPKLLHA
jgi:hypothetical protein